MDAEYHIFALKIHLSRPFISYIIYKCTSKAIAPTMHLVSTLLQI